jgi:hypothetical protein
MRTVLLSLGIAFIAASCGSAGNKEPETAKNNTAEKPATALQERTIVDTLNNITDTSFIVGQYKLTFKKTDSVAIPDLYTSKGTRETAEDALPADVKKHFKRTGKKLTLLFEDGKNKTYTDGPEDEVYFTFDSYLPAINYGVIEVIEGAESVSYLLVNLKNGKQKIVIGKPVIANSGKQIITASEDLEAAFSSNGFQMLTKQVDSLVTNFTFEANGWGPVSLKWLSENTVVFKVDRQIHILEGDHDLKVEYYKLTIDRN